MFSSNHVQSSRLAAGCMHGSTAECTNLPTHGLQQTLRAARHTRVNTNYAWADSCMLNLIALARMAMHSPHVMIADVRPKWVHDPALADRSKH